MEARGYISEPEYWSQIDAVRLLFGPAEPRSYRPERSIA